MTKNGDDTAGRAPAWASIFAPDEWAWFVRSRVDQLRSYDTLRFMPPPQFARMLSSHQQFQESH